MGYYDRAKLEPRGDKDPKFNMKNKTDRKIFFLVLFITLFGIALIAGLFIIYFVYFKR